MRQVSNSPETGINFRHILSYPLRRDINSPGTDIAVGVQWWYVSLPPHLHRTACYPDVKHWPRSPSAPKEERNFVSVFPDYASGSWYPVGLCVMYLYLLLIKANDGESISHNFPTVFITDGAHPWTVTLTERERLLQTNTPQTCQQCSWSDNVD